MINVTGFPSGQRLVWALQTFTKSGKEIAPSEFALFETTARSRAAAQERLAATNSEAPISFRKNTLAPSTHKSHVAILMDFGHWLNVTKVIHLEVKRSAVDPLNWPSSRREKG